MPGPTEHSDSAESGAGAGSGESPACGVSTETVPLPRLRAGVCAMIQAVLAPADDAARLKTLGVCVGRKVELVKGGDPLILRVLGSRIGLSARLAEQVVVCAGCEDPVCRKE